MKCAMSEASSVVGSIKLYYEIFIFDMVSLPVLLGRLGLLIGKISHYLFKYFNFYIKYYLFEVIIFDVTIIFIL